MMMIGLSLLQANCQKFYWSVSLTFSIDLHIGHAFQSWGAENVNKLVSDFENALENVRGLPKYARESVAQALEPVVEKLEDFLTTNNYIPSENNKVCFCQVCYFYFWENLTITHQICNNSIFIDLNKFKNPNSRGESMSKYRK